jgi:DNA-binding XRE family transcriptional regulator
MINRIRAGGSKKSGRGQYPEINQRFREIRIDNRLTQSEMGEKVGLSSAAIGAIEQGLYTPNFSVMRNLNKHFRVSYSYLIDGIKDDSDALRNKVGVLEDKVKSLEDENQRLKRIIDKLTI